MPPKLLIVSLNKKAALFLKTSLDEVFDGQISIDAYSFIDDELECLRGFLAQKPLLAMATGAGSYQRLLEYYPKAQCIRGARDISAPQYVDRLFSIPIGEKVLVVNETKNGCFETISAIQGLGINHLSYIPYWQNCDVETTGIKIAISPGMTHYGPPHIEQKVDIGMRNLAAATLIKILNTYNLDIEYLEKYIGNQKKVLVATYEKLNQENERSRRIKDSLQEIIDVLDEAIIALGPQEQITNLNKAALKLLNISPEAALNKRIQTVFKEIAPDKPAFQGQENLVVKINDKQIYLTYSPLNNPEINVGILKLSSVENIQKNEEQVRKIIYEQTRGHLARYNFADIFTACEKMEKVIREAKFFAQTDSTILIAGESGTGKEMLAQSMHNHSKRAKGPFIAVNFAALPDNLIESELFGYAEGAFTGAKKSGKKGLFELAHKGTIFLDEIGHASLWLQKRLLRVLEEKEIMRLGDTRVIPVDIRVIVATNKNLKKLVEEEKFLPDLYYRINVFQINLPPLRERRESILPLLELLLKKSDCQKTFSREAIDCILNYAWPGNVRELRNMVEYATQIAETDIIGSADLPYDLRMSGCFSATEPEKYQDIFVRLKLFLNLAQVRFILNILQENKAKHKLGRSKLLLLLQGQGLDLSDRKLRTIFKYLAAYDLIQIGNTKQGTWLTAAGEGFLAYLAQQDI